MPQDMRIWRVKARQKLIEALGGKCCEPGCGSTENLVFAHITPLTEEQSAHRSRMGMTHRMVQYRKEHAEGLLKLNCQRCNILEARKQGRSTTPTERLKNDGNPF